jgi:hypothetical protein
MKPTLTGVLLVAAAFAAINTADAQGKSPAPAYTLSVRIDPAAGRVEGKTEVRGLQDTAVMLNAAMEISRFESAGRAVPFTRKPSGFMPGTTEVLIPAGFRDSLLIEYAGEMNQDSYPPILSAANMIRPGLVELAMYLTWYPRPASGAVFTFDLNADLPSDYVTVTNGTPAGKKEENGRNITQWKSYAPGNDIALLAAPNLRRADTSLGSVAVEIYYDKLPLTYVDSMKTNLLRSMDRLTTLLGKPAAAGLIRVAYSPRQAWGYVRMPFIVVSEGNALSWRSKEFGTARDFRYLTHEIAHYWWKYANMATPDDWINEGLAEYSAFMVSREIVGKEFADRLLVECRERASQSKTADPVEETQATSRDREINRYDKPVLLLNALRVKYGDAKFDAFLRALYSRFSSANDATTAMFLEVTRKELGAEARAMVQKAVYGKVWVEPGVQ